MKALRHYSSLFAVSLVLAQNTPGQPQRKGQNGQFELIGNSLVSAQQVSRFKKLRIYLIYSPRCFWARRTRSISLIKWKITLFVSRIILPGLKVRFLFVFTGKVLILV